MRLLLVSDDGQVIDSTDEFTREDWEGLTTHSAGALDLLRDLNPDAIR